jgi:hypothetical protein
MIKLAVHAKLVSAQLGDSDIGTTMNRYGYLYPGQDAEVADQLNRAYETAQAEAKTSPGSVARIG